MPTKTTLTAAALQRKEDESCARVIRGAKAIGPCLARFQELLRDIEAYETARAARVKFGKGRS